MRRTVKVLSYILISSIVTSLVFAGDKKTEEELFKNKQIEKNRQVERDRNQQILDIDHPDRGRSLTIRSTSKPYSGFIGTIVTPKQKQYPEGIEGAILELLDNWDNIPPEDMAIEQE